MKAKDTAARRIAVLERRADHLAKRIAQSDNDLTYDKAELSALLWAIRTLQKQFGVAPKKEKP